jgi:hypothetical protein
VRHDREDVSSGVRTASRRRETKEEQAVRFRMAFSLALALVVLVAVGPAAASSTGSTHYTQQGLRADGLRLQGIARRYSSMQDRSAASFYTREALNAMGLRWLAMARSYARPEVSTVSGGGFDWADAGIGAAAGSALTLCMAVLIVFVRRPRETKVAA